jgi:hypothetical protein
MSSAVAILNPALSAKAVGVAPKAGNGAIPNSPAVAALAACAKNAPMGAKRSRASTLCADAITRDGKIASIHLALGTIHGRSRLSTEAMGHEESTANRKTAHLRQIPLRSNKR